MLWSPRLNVGNKLLDFLTFGDVSEVTGGCSIMRVIPDSRHRCAKTRPIFLAAETSDKLQDKTSCII